MNKKIYSLFLFFFIAGIAFAQNQSRLDLRTYKRLKQGNATEAYSSLLVKGNTDAIKALAEKFGGTYKYGYNDISSVSIPEKNLLAFSESIAIEKIEGTTSQGTFLMDTSRIRSNVDSIHAGFAPLPANLKGRNVVMGIIDGGIYWQHFDFKKPTDSTTRIKYIWDQAVSGGNVPTYGYGRQWTSTEINNGTCTHVPPNNDFGHGTCVAGIAAGNSLSTKGTAYDSLFRGVAPETDIIAVRVRSGNNFLTSVADAVDYIFKKADSLGKPCVINTSIGDYYGSHDGNDLTSHLIDAMITQKNGRVLVAAAGNAGMIAHHVSYPIPADSAYTLLKYINANGGYLYFDWWADTANFKNAQFAIGCNAANGANIGRTAYLNLPANFTLVPNGPSQYFSTHVYDGLGADMGEVEMYASISDNRYYVEVLVTPTSSSYIWRLQTRGSGTFDMWATNSLHGTSDIITNVNTTDPAIRQPDLYKTMVSSWQNSDKVITVGNYSNRASYVDRDGVTQNMTIAPNFEVVGRRYGTSSWGPTRDNRVKPDVMAPGSTTICTGDANFIALATAPANRLKVSITLKHIRNGGTSMASPVVAGIAALYLELYPNASYSEIKQALICSATTDNFTGAVPNAEYGNGKVNAFAAIARPCVPISGITDTGCLNYNPLANVSGGSCVPKVYGVMDTGCVNYNPLANVSGGVCIPKVYGITDTSCINYNPLANVSSGTCVPKVYGIMDTACVNYNAQANVSGGVCIPKVYGITDTACLNFDPLANVSSGTCVPKVYGVLDTSCANYNPLANVIGSTCVPKVYGITDTACLNYDPLATVSSGVCTPKIYGIMDTACLNYDANANVSGGICVAKVYGITDTSCLNYDPLATVSSGVCTPKIYGIMDTACLNYDANANVSSGTCVAKVYGIMDTTCINYNAHANVANGTCNAKVYGITDTACVNYNAAANVSNGSCVAKVYGVMDTACTNYNPAANVSSGICIPLSVNDLTGVRVQVMPNPFSNQTTFVVDGLNYKKAAIRIYTPLGQLVDELLLADGKNQYVYLNDKLAKGIYQYQLLADGKNIKTGKLVVQ